MKEETSKPAARAWFKRPLLRRAEPLRDIGTLYRSAEGPAGSALGGVPLSSAEDAVVAAVRMGYRVAQANIDRAGRVAERLNQAGERAVGAEPQRQAVDAAEQLVGKALLAGLEWLEGSAAQPGSPLRRYASAQYKLFGALLGLQPEAAGSAPAAAAAPTAAPRGPAARTIHRLVRVLHLSKERRAVHSPRLHFDQAGVEGKFALSFYCAAHLDKAIRATLVVAAAQPAVLSLATSKNHPAGVWKAAICSDDGEQLGWAEFEL